MKPITALSLLAATVALASCQSDRAPRGLPTTTAQQAAPQGVEGVWVDTNGLISTFGAGKFDTRPIDANVAMATGTYIAQPSGLVEINLFSNISQRTSKVNCSLIGPTQLNCTSQDGKQFSLTRRA